MYVYAVKTADVNLERLAELTFTTRERLGLLKAYMTEDTLLVTMRDRLLYLSDESVFVAEDDGRIVGWLALYRPSDAKIAQVWDWHPVVHPDEDEHTIAHGLIRAAFSHLEAIGMRQVSIDFPADARTRSSFLRYQAWYAEAGITEVVEESYYKKDISEEDLAVHIPDGYALGRISETDLDELYHCWLRIFSSSDDQFLLQLDAEARRDFFLESWSREAPMIEQASLTLRHHGELIGISRLLPKYEPEDGHVAPIGMLPDYRRRGLARELLKMSACKLRETGYKTMSCYVNTGNLAAVAFYEAFGFKSKHRILSLFGDVVSSTKARTV